MLLVLCWYITCMLRLARPRHRILRRSACSTVCDRRRSCEFVDFRNSMRVLGRIASKERVPVSQLICRLEFLCTQYYRWWTEEAWLVHAELSMIYNMRGRHEREVIVASCSKLSYVVIAVMSRSTCMLKRSAHFWC